MMLKKCCLFLAFTLMQLDMAMTPNTYIAFISGFNEPVNMAITPNNLYGYVADNAGNNVLVIDTDPSSSNFNTLIDAPNLMGAFNHPYGIAITPDSSRAYVTDSGSDSVLVIDTNPSSPSFNDFISAPALNGTFNSPGGIAITPNGLYAYVIDNGSNSVRVIDLTSNTILTTPDLDSILNAPFAIAITPNGNYAYISNLSGSVTVVDIASNTPVNAPGLASVNAQPEGLAITADGLYAYVTDASGANNVTFLDLTQNTVISAAGLDAAFNAPNGVVTTPGGNYYAYVTNFLGATGSISSVSLIDINPSSLTYNTVLDTPSLVVPSPPSVTRFVSLTMAPNGQYVYAVDVNNNFVAVIYTGLMAPPSNFSGCKVANRFLLQQALVNHLTWSAPMTGLTPVGYKIYHDAALTELVASVPATTLSYDDYSTNNVYYIVSVDDLGNLSGPTSTIVTSLCS